MTESDLVTSRALKAVWESCTWSRGLERGKRVAFCTSWRSLCQSRKAAKGEVMVKDTREGRARSRRGGGVVPWEPAEGCGAGSRAHGASSERGRDALGSRALDRRVRVCVQMEGQTALLFLPFFIRLVPHWSS